MKTKQQRKQTRQQFLLTFFDKPDCYEEKEVNGFYLVRQFNKSANQWNVAIFDKESYKLKKEYLDSQPTKPML